mmetsp:Transcript_7510/g.23283  ORF Transcript_7510/g.23283 Transcript_7510/m.23283 type:complete len:204 (+) Transcript_7510:1429-2040(+)
MCLSKRLEELAPLGLADVASFQQRLAMRIAGGPKSVAGELRLEFFDAPAELQDLGCDEGIWGLHRRGARQAAARDTLALVTASTERAAHCGRLHQRADDLRGKAETRDGRNNGVNRGHCFMACSMADNLDLRLARAEVDSRRDDSWQRGECFSHGADTAAATESIDAQCDERCRRVDTGSGVRGVSGHTGGIGGCLGGRRGVH